jgi:hypothetical protein
VQIGKRPNEKIKVEKFRLGVAYLNLCAASIDYQSTLFCILIICSWLKWRREKAPKTWHNGCRLLIILLFLIGYFVPYPDFAQQRNTKSKLCVYTERQTSHFTEISMHMQHHLYQRWHKVKKAWHNQNKECVHDSCEKRTNTRLKI